MKPVERSEILPLDEYERIRPHFRTRIIQEKSRRRAALGDIMSVMFENHDTVLLQIQEMLRTERITREQGIAHELDTYNELVPADDQLSMTLFIEILEREERERMLVALCGMEEHVHVEIDGERFPAGGAAREGAESERTTAVQYYKIHLGNEAAHRLRSGEAKTVVVVIDHPAYRARAELGPEVRAELAGDLAWSSQSAPFASTKSMPPASSSSRSSSPTCTRRWRTSSSSSKAVIRS
jgi:hypothetical protein